MLTSKPFFVTLWTEAQAVKVLLFWEVVSTVTTTIGVETNWSGLIETLYKPSCRREAVKLFPIFTAPFLFIFPAICFDSIETIYSFILKIMILTKE